jgi:hypothetical protein
MWMSYISSPPCCLHGGGGSDLRLKRAFTQAVNKDKSLFQDKTFLFFIAITYSNLLAEKYT